MQRYDQFFEVENNIKQKHLSPILASNSKSIFSTSDSFLLIMSQLSYPLLAPLTILPSPGGIDYLTLSKHYKSSYPLLATSMILPFPAAIDNLIPSPGSITPGITHLTLSWLYQSCYPLPAPILPSPGTIINLTLVAPSIILPSPSSINHRTLSWHH